VVVIVIYRWKIRSLRDLANANIDELKTVWRNRRSWSDARGIASHLSKLSADDRIALRLGLEMLSLKIGEETLLEGLGASA
jgi:hypothetical protein